MYQEEQEIFPNVPICECLKLRQTRLENNLNKLCHPHISLENLYEHFS